MLKNDYDESEAFDGGLPAIRERFWIWCARIIVVCGCGILFLMFWPGLEYEIGKDEIGFEINRWADSDRRTEGFHLGIGEFCLYRKMGSREVFCTVHPRGWCKNGGSLVWTGSDSVFCLNRAYP